MTDPKTEVHELLDALYIELFNLIEQQTICRVNIEKLSKGGQLLLAKTRYVQGTNSIGIAQIPTENNDEFKALCRIQDEADESTVCEKKFILEKQAVNKDQGFIEPMQWFGVLPPSSLRLAAEQFKKCVEQTVESANIQRETIAVMESIKRVKQFLDRTSC